MSVSIVGVRFARLRKPPASVGRPQRKSTGAASTIIPALKTSGDGHITPKTISGIIQAMIGAASTQPPVIRRFAASTLR